MKIRGEWKSWLKAQHSKNWDHIIWSHHFMVNRWGNSGNSGRLYFLGLQNHWRWWFSHEIKRCLPLGRKALTKLETESEVAQSCPTLCDPMDFSLPGTSIHGIFKARVPEWVAISFSRGSSLPRDQTRVFCIVGRCFYHLSHDKREPN